ncbi:BTB/POZ and MATH domain-containing protein 2 [Rhynchospora pubera]|uniref:BTB/POZ and MATH domain-containing protein 2 n=1 Tax=Rhynchospora pubera TaxID=906938 RepID=A0AAV8F561_9POAL|nr:BTB/POZ and MATH domain-containing protein 2 [Rhynchospora pubera]
MLVQEVRLKMATSQSHSLVGLIKSSSNHIEFNYSESKHLPVNEFVTSPCICVGGYNWALEFFPRGLDSDEENKGTHVFLFLNLLSEMKDVSAEYSFNILDKTGKYLPLLKPIVQIFSSNSNSSESKGCSISRDKLEARFCKDGMLVISFSIKVLSAPSEFLDQSSWLHHDVKKLWDRGERFDVTFEVEGEKISAHRFMLAARSPVFETELYGPMAEAKSSCIKIKDMKAEVFDALLRFVYTDNYDNFEKVLSIELVQDLFLAADRYALEKLKVLCQQRLWGALSVDTVLSTLIVAERLSSAWLKEKCLEFASMPENFTELALTEEYVQMVQSFPSLLIELRQQIQGSSGS